MKFIISHLKNEDAPKVVKKAGELFPSGLGINGMVGPVYKRRAKNRSELGYPDQMVAIGKCEMYITGYVSVDGEVYVWPAFVNEDQWFKTSPVENVKVEGGMLIIETQNSVYEVEL